MRKLIAGPTVFICDECVEVCNDIIADDNRFEKATEELLELRDLEPTDTTGARYLWQEGWKEYTQRNLSGAIGSIEEFSGLAIPFQLRQLSKSIYF